MDWINGWIQWCRRTTVFERLRWNSSDKVRGMPWADATSIISLRSSRKASSGSSKKRVKGHSEKNYSFYLNNTLRKVLTRTEHICNPVAPLMQEGPLSSFVLFTFIDPLFFRFSEHLLHAVRKRQARCQVGWFASFAFNRSMIQRFTGAIEVKEELRALEMQIKIKLNQETEDQTHQTWFQCQVFLFSLKVWNHLLKSFQLPLQNCCCNWQSC